LIRSSALAPSFYASGGLTSTGSRVGKRILASRLPTSTRGVSLDLIDTFDNVSGKTLKDRWAKMTQLCVNLTLGVTQERQTWRERMMSGAASAMRFFVVFPRGCPALSAVSAFRMTPKWTT
jgi:hypothetical protein